MPASTRPSHYPRGVPGISKNLAEAHLRFRTALQEATPAPSGVASRRSKGESLGTCRPFGRRPPSGRVTDAADQLPASFRSSLPVANPAPPEEHVAELARHRRRARVQLGPPAPDHV